MRKPSNVASWKGSPFAVAVMFLGNGFVLASSYSRMPGIRDQLGSTPTQLAFALVCMGIGSILGMPITGRLVDRYSSRMISLVATVICLGGWAALPMARSVPELALMLLITGVGAGVSGVAMNARVDNFRIGCLMIILRLRQLGSSHRFEVAALLSVVDRDFQWLIVERMFPPTRFFKEKQV